MRPEAKASGYLEAKADADPCGMTKKQEKQKSKKQMHIPAG
jgi:hypothetical protein